MNDQSLSSLCSINPESLGPGTPGGFEFDYIDISSVTRGQISWDDVRRLAYKNAPSRARRRLRSGDVLLCTVRPALQSHAHITNDNGVPRVGSTGFAALRPNDARDSSFVFHQLFSESVASQLRAMETGSNYPAVNERDVSRIRFFAPDVEERSRIAMVLDAVDAAIEKTAAVIAKLKQVRAGLIHDLLTCGLDDSGELRDPLAQPEQFKDSPVGRIPIGWDVCPCDRICREIVVGIVVTPAKYYVSSGIPVLRSANLREDGVALDDLVFISPASNLLHRKSIIRVGDVLTVRTGYPGTTCVVPESLDGANCVDIIISRPGSLIVPDFLALWVNSPFGKDQVLKTQGGLAQQHFNIREMRNLLAAVPSKPEQDAIVGRIVCFDHLRSSEEISRCKLEILKSGLTSDLLTGRIPVPEKIATGLVA